MKREEYYMSLYNRYLEAETSVKEEQELKAFLAETDSPRFDEAKAVLGFFVCGRQCIAAQETVAAGLDAVAVQSVQNKTVLRFVPGRRMLKYAAAVAVVCVAAATVYFSRPTAYVLYANGEKNTDRNVVIDEMENDMEMMLATEFVSIEVEMSSMLR